VSGLEWFQTDATGGVVVRIGIVCRQSNQIGDRSGLEFKAHLQDVPVQWLYHFLNISRR
jgi:hypothetical protein